MSASTLHAAILASAGSGKTFRLAHRYIGWLLKGVAPDRIAALTFTNRAAGEILDSIVGYLVDGAASDAKTKILADRIGEPSLKRAQVILALRTLLDALHRHRIGTLDSFGIRLARLMAVEAGLPAELSVTDGKDPEAAAARDELRRRVLAGRDVRESDVEFFFEAFRRATFGREERSIAEKLDGFLDTDRRLLRECPDINRWGNPSRIWPTGVPRRDAKIPVKDAIELIAHWAAGQGKFGEALVKDAEKMASASRRASWPKLATLAQRLLESVDSLRDAATVSIAYSRKSYDLPEPVCRAAYALLCHLYREDTESACERTHGIGTVLAVLDAMRLDEMRIRGRLEFDDVQRLLNPDDRINAFWPDMPRWREALFYRLDGMIDHWMIDEFQDTSDTQWNALQPLVDEVLQDNSGARSFFFVGDIKQSIYGWRGGNPRLFGRLLDYYRGRVQQEFLDESRRSCPPVIEFVNKLFTNPPEQMQPQAVTRWNKLWRKHVSASELAEKPGYAALLIPSTPEEGDEADEVEAKGPNDLIPGVVRHLDPVRRQWSVAVLVRTNQIGREVTESIRRECPEIPVVFEGDSPVLQNPVGALLRSLLAWAAHPGDTLAWGHLLMSPLREEMMGANLPMRIARQMAEHGARALVADWIGRLEKAAALDAFGRRCADDLLEAAAYYDANGRRHLPDFIRYLENRGVGDSAAAGTVAVLTIHRAKGLGFDAVIVADHERGRSYDSAGKIERFVSRETPEAEVDWVLEGIHRDICQMDPVLKRELDAGDEDHGFEALCNLYVATTRAKRGLYVVSNQPKNNKTANTRLMLWNQLVATDAEPRSEDRYGSGCLVAAEFGDPDWMTEHAAKTIVTQGAEAMSRMTLPPERAPRLTPSAQAEESRSAGLVFGSTSRTSIEVGIALHDFMQKLEWWDAAAGPKLLKTWAADQQHAAPVITAVENQINDLTKSPGFHDVFDHPNGHVRVWRERTFDLVMDGRWVTGTFDRVVIDHDASGKPHRAWIVDFKTNLIEPGDTEAIARKVEDYRPQLEHYRQAVAQLLNLAPEKIRCSLLLTAIGEVADIAPHDDNQNKS